MFDAIIVGARCAGSSTAMLLAKRGYKVLLLDRAVFPSDTLSSHFIHPAGVACLDRWGILDQVIASNCPAVSQITFDAGAVVLKGSPVPVQGHSEGYGPRRFLLDHILVRAAVEAGAELRESFIVESLMTENGRVTGVRGRTNGGPVIEERARIVIGADGAHSFVAKSVKADHYDVRPTLSCNYYSYWSGLNLDGVELYPRDGRIVITFPTNNGLTLVTVAWTRNQFHRVRANLEQNFWSEIDRFAPSLANRMRAGKREERFSGTGDLPNFFRKSHGNGWALVGDASYHKDPITAQGITNSFQGAELLAAAIDQGFSGTLPMQTALDWYERTRYTMSTEMYGYTCELAQLSPPSRDAQRLLTALEGNQPQIARFLGLMAGSVRPGEFFSAANVEAILERRDASRVAA
jgi:flavin-dependent dehydrogenase